MRRAVVVWSATAAFAAGFGALAVLRHRAFESGRFDLGNMAQAVWSTAHGDVLSVTDVHGEQISRLGAHFDPLLVAAGAALVALAEPELLLVVQAVARRRRRAARLLARAKAPRLGPAGGRARRSRTCSPRPCSG